MSKAERARIIGFALASAIFWAVGSQIVPAIGVPMMLNDGAGLAVSLLLLTSCVVGYAYASVQFFDMMIARHKGL